MTNMREALRVRAELALWAGRKAVHQPRIKELKSKYILEQDDVNRMETGLPGFFAKMKPGYDERLEKEKGEVDAAKEKLDEIAALMEEADKKLPMLEAAAEQYQEHREKLDEAALHGDEKALLDWCKGMELGKAVAMENTVCIALVEEAIQKWQAAADDKSALFALQHRLDRLYEMAEGFFKAVGKAEELPKWKRTLLVLNQSEPLVAASSLGKGVELFSDMITASNILFKSLEDIKKLGVLLAELVEELAKEGEGLLQKMSGGESHFCERETVVLEEVQPKPALEASGTDAYIYPKEKIAEIPSITPMGAAKDFFGQTDTSKEKERVLFGLDLLRKEFAQIMAQAEKENANLAKRLLNRWDNDSIDSQADSIKSWERALKEWQNDLKQYRKNAGNFPCALDGYVPLEQKLWQYTEENAAEMQKTYQRHLKETEGKLAEAEHQIKMYER